MKLKTFQIFSIVLMLLFLNACTSVKKYNAQISKDISPTLLKEDIDYAYKKLKKLHPNLYLYITKKQLDQKFSALKSSINKPLSSIAFYKQLTPVITSIKQGHASLNPPFKQQTKKEFKTKGKRNYIFKSVTFKNIQNKIIIEKTYGKDSTLIIGSELISIANNKVDDLIQSFKNLHTGDGFNKTFMPEFTRKYIGSFYLRTHGLKDSIQLTLKYKDSLYSKYLYAYTQKNIVKKDSIKIKKLSKEAKKLAKKKQKERVKWENKYGYNKYTKESNRNLKFIKNDTSLIAYLKIRGFSRGEYKSFYKEAFKKIDSVKSKNLIIDLRDNRGGRLSEIADLYSYLTTKEHYFVNRSKMTKSSSWLYPFLHSDSFLIKSATILLYPIVKLIEIKFVKNIDGQPHFNLSSSKLQQPKTVYNYNGKIYVLINGISFSASSIISNQLKATKRAFFVGDETGGAYNSTVAGRYANIKLPNSKLKLNFGLMNIDTQHKTTPKGFGVKPDKYIKVTTLEKDEQLDWIINDIKGKN